MEVLSKTKQKIYYRPVEDNITTWQMPTPATQNHVKSSKKGKTTDSMDSVGSTKSAETDKSRKTDKQKISTESKKCDEENTCGPFRGATVHSLGGGCAILTSPLRPSRSFCQLP